jgi:thiol-disulfide isomerase/thioredoxin
LKWYTSKVQEVLFVTVRKIVIICAVLVFAAVAVSKYTQRQQSNTSLGKAPSFKLRNLAGQEVSLDQYRGKVVLLDFWATWCGPCQMTMPLLERLEKENPKNMTLLAINIGESAETVRDYVRLQNVSSEVLLDEDSAVGSAYGASAIPLQVLIDKNGVIRHTHAGLGPDTIAQLRAEIQKLQ